MHDAGRNVADVGFLSTGTAGDACLEQEFQVQGHEVSFLAASTNIGVATCGELVWVRDCHHVRNVFEADTGGRCQPAE